MIPEPIYKKTYIICPHCGKITDAVRGMGIWWNKKCSQCSRKIRVWNMRRSIVTCQSCGNDVVFNALSAMPEYCPSCHNLLQNPVGRERYRSVQCPTCGTNVLVASTKGSVHCALCDTTFDVEHELAKKDQRSSSSPVLIQCAANVTDILWKYPNNSFPHGTQLVVNEGTAAIILQNGALKTVASPGSYALEDTVLSLEEKLQSDGSWTYTTDIFFVQERPAVVYTWGTANPYTLRDGDRSYTVRAHGRLRLCVTDPMQLARNLNFTNLNVSGKRANSPSDMIGDLVNDQVGMCFAAPLQEIIRMEGLRLRLLTATDVQEKFVAAIDRRLEVFGLEVAENTFIIEHLDTVETQLSEKDKKIRLVMERPITWKTEPISIHMKGDLARGAQVVLGGSVTPQVSDIDVLENSTLDLNGLDRATRVSETLTGLYNQILQKMIDDTDVDLRELNQYYSYLQSTTTDCLNFAFQRYGLSFSNITIRQESFTPSRMLQAYFDDEENRRRVMDETGKKRFNNQEQQKQLLDAENMRRFMQDLRVRERTETGQFEVELLRIETETEEAKQPYDTRLKEILTENEERDAGLKIRRAEAANRVMLNDLRIQQQQKAKEYEAELAEVAHAVDMKEMYHKIDAADLNWQEKLDAYWRLHQIQKFTDSMDEKRMEAEVDKAIGFGRLELTREEEELQNHLKDLQAKRDENQKQADFTRDLEMLTAMWSAEFNELQAIAELEDTKAQLDYLAKQGISEAFFEQAKAAAEREHAERLRAEKARDDENFETRSRVLLAQMRGFKDTLVGDPARQQIFDSVSKESFDSILTSLTSIVDSLARSIGYKDDGFAGFSKVNVVATPAKPKQSSGANFSPKGVKG